VEGEEIESPKIHGEPIEIRFLPSPRAYRGKLLSGNGSQGREVHAGCFPRRRLIVLDAALSRRPRQLARILIHELLHFAWIRLGNPKRLAFERLLMGEIRHRATGELGWSAERMKASLTRDDRLRRTRRWREYVCESFCDSGAWLFVGGRNKEFTLGAAAQKGRRAWFAQWGLIYEISV
jgi:hypothetical protein